METIDKINHANSLIQYSNVKLNRLFSNLETWVALQGAENTIQKERIYKQIEGIKGAQTRLINYIRRQAMNLIIEIK